jgi:leucyl aminopeptidase
MALPRLRPYGAIDFERVSMSELLKLNFAPLALPKRGTLVLLTDEKLGLGKLASVLQKKSGRSIAKAAAAAKFKGKRGATLDILLPRGLKYERLVVIGLGKISEMKAIDWINLGGRIASQLSAWKTEDAFILAELPAGALEVEKAADMALGARLASYKFDRYKVKTKDKDVGKLKRLTFLVANAAEARKHMTAIQAVTEGVDIARELVNAPPNILGPVEFAAECKKLSKLGVKVTVFTEREMKKLGMGALLGVGQGSAATRGSRLAVMEWNGGSKKQKPVAMVGKGVVFDTGGISIKPADKMEDMKGDMAGAACVTGLMHTLAARKARANVIGVVGLVENMPDANAQRPGDIVTSMSGQTIEIINTDAEGRLVLADALWYTQERFKPQAMIDLATLTGAVLVALGQEHAGLFSNNDELAQRLLACGKTTGEKLWQLPLSEDYNKLMNSKFADMKNSGGRYAGSITAAQFLQRFVNNVPWAHLDIAGTGMGMSPSDINKSWGPGFGVRLLNNFIAEHYED